MSLVRDLEGEEGSLTGFGDSIVNLPKLMAMDPTDAIRCLNAIVTAVELCLSSDWSESASRSS